MDIETLATIHSLSGELLAKMALLDKTTKEMKSIVDDNEKLKSEVLVLKHDNSDLIDENAKLRGIAEEHKNEAICSVAEHAREMACKEAEMDKLDFKVNALKDCLFKACEIIQQCEKLNMISEILDSKGIGFCMDGIKFYRD